MSEIEATFSPHLVSSEEIRQNITEWTPEKLARYESKPHSYWSFRRYIYALNWLKPASKRRYITRAKEFGHLLASVELQDADFREDITLDWCYVATQWATGGKTYLQHSRAGVFTDYLAHIPQVQAQLESSECPDIIKRWYKEDLQQYYAGEEYMNSLRNSKSLEATTTPKLDLFHTPYPFESPQKHSGTPWVNPEEGFKCPKCGVTLPSVALYSCPQTGCPRSPQIR